MVGTMALPMAGKKVVKMVEPMAERRETERAALWVVQWAGPTVELSAAGTELKWAAKMVVHSAVLMAVQSAGQRERRKVETTADLMVGRLALRKAEHLAV